jgi:hypothetical protein
MTPFGSAPNRSTRLRPLGAPVPSRVTTPEEDYQERSDWLDDLYAAEQAEDRMLEHSGLNAMAAPVDNVELLPVRDELERAA